MDWITSINNIYSDIVNSKICIVDCRSSTQEYKEECVECVACRVSSGFHNNSLSGSIQGRSIQESRYTCTQVQVQSERSHKLKKN